MKPAPFTYVRPRSLAEALQVLDDTSKVLAGGQSLMPLLNLRALSPSRLVDINGLTELAGLFRDEDGVLHIGACVRQAQVERSPLAGRLLPQALRHVALPVIRNRGTVVGSLCHQDPAAELGAVAVTLDTEWVVQSRRGTRVVTAADWFVDYYTTALQPDELVTEVRMRLEAPTAGTAFLEVNRAAGAFAIVGCAVVAEQREGQVVAARAGFCGVAPVPVAITLPTPFAARPAVIAEVADAACAHLDPPDDVAAPAWYRRKIAPVLLRRGLLQALGIPAEVAAAG
jgi:carbon-monoxide dehydrogenase medium subunit